MKVTRRGQVTIPQEIRRATGIEEDTEVEFHLEKGRVIITKKVGDNPFGKWVGSADTPGSRKSGRSDELVRAMRGHR